MPSLLFGSRPERVERGTFSCPQCGDRRSYGRTVVRRSLTLLSVSLPLGRCGEYIECEACLATYRPEVLAYDAGDATGAAMVEYQRVMRHVLALMVVTDGAILEPEIQTVQRVFEAVSGQRLGRDEVLAEIRDVQRQPTTVARYLAQMMPYLNGYGKEQVLRAVALVSSADGIIHPRESDMAHRLAAVMRMEPQQTERVLAEFA